MYKRTLGISFAPKDGIPSLLQFTNPINLKTVPHKIGRILLQIDVSSIYEHTRAVVFIGGVNFIVSLWLRG